MKKRDLILAGALLLGMSVQAQEQLFFYGFEADETALDGPDSLKIPVDSIKQLTYYDVEEGASTVTGADVREWEELEPIDTAIYLVNGISPLASRGDLVNVTKDNDGQHAIEFENMGAKGGEYYLTYKADTVGGATSDCNDYEANIFVRGLPIKDNTSYRLSYYVKASAAVGHLQTDVLRGWYNSEKPFSMAGESSAGTFVGSKKDFSTDRWERVTMMTYYLNDSVANHYMYQQGYYWGDAWKKVINNKTYNYIKQPDTYFVRFSFRTPGVTYYVDDIALTESWIAGAEYNGQVMRVDFGYDTNMAEICEADPLKSKKLPYEYFDLVGYYYENEGDEEWIEEVLPIYGAEYHNDGYLYIWLDEDVTFDGLDSVGLNFRNPGAETGLQLKYDGTLYPMALDTNWVNAGKIVPDFSSEPAFYNPEISATSQDMMPPLVQSLEPVAGSFTLDSNSREIKVTFNKTTYAVLNCKDTEEKGVMAKLTGSGVSEFWIPTAYDEETFTVTFSRQAKDTAPLNGDYTFEVYQMRAVSFGEEGEDYSCIYSFGELGDAPKFMAKLDFSGYNKGDVVPGIVFDRAKNIAEVTEFQGLFEKALKFGAFGASGLDSSTGGQKISYTFNVTEAGDWYVNYGTSGCLKNSWNDGARMVVSIVDAEGTNIYTYDEGGTNNKPSEGGMVDSVDVQSTLVNFPAAGEYTVSFALPNELSMGGSWGHQGGRILYYFEVCSQQTYGRAWNYIAAFNLSLANAQATIAKAEANTIYTGAALEALKAFVADNEDFISKSPVAYNEMNASFAAEIGKMNTRMSIVDAYYAAYDATKVLVDSMKAIDGYKDLAAVATASASLAANKDLNVVPLTDDEIKALTDQFNAETKAINDRCTAIADFQKALEAALTVIEDNAETAYVEFDEYKALQKAYNENKDLAVYTVTDEELANATKLLSDSTIAIQGKVNSIPILTAQVKGLAQLATTLQVSWGAVDAEELAAQLAAETEDNQKLAGVYQLAIKAAIEGIFAEASIEESINMTNFIQNAGFYTTTTSSSINKGSDVLPGWNITTSSGATSGSQYGSGNITADASAPVKDTYLAMNWNSGITVSQELVNLPAGIYTLGVGYQSESPFGGYVLVEQFDADNNKIQTDTLNWSGSGYSHASPAANQFLDSLAITGAVTKITSVASTTSGWAVQDNWSLTLDARIEGYDYAAAAAASQAALGEAYTGVNAIVTPSKVEFYNLNGMQVTEPNKGVNIRISTGANGQRVIEKVLIK